MVRSCILVKHAGVFHRCAVQSIDVAVEPTMTTILSTIDANDVPKAAQNVVHPKDKDKKRNDLGQDGPMAGEEKADLFELVPEP